LDDQSTDIRVAISRYCKQQGYSWLFASGRVSAGFDLFKSTT